MSWSLGGGPLLLATGPAVARGHSSCQQRLATGGRDGVVRVWQRTEGRSEKTWACSAELVDGSHGAELTDVAWRPTRCLPSSCIASSYDDGSVLVWTQDFAGRPWRQEHGWLTSADACRLSWSPCGLFLAVSTGEDAMELFRQLDDGSWDRIDADK